ncbi:LysR substrate-binding domain-containing protein [Shewanella schlegeliana]|uniref:LysR family transcriptional regulator n=1 Tax=Shewanella schlegeliana TaxID=190308 RepID=A0ABS1SX24_9GAMM|nr:LysR substrate-binding domain-containing protein [Shewanella schlegeliana]MBL4913091.1 LysR family transcriptional regulator [Shewanella schlegeliana]MCL1111105.1 LysR substrate-binding domain-containing protein [Shewanella schlegeliana]GIU28288.1 LysR family transcriptional regulator [Shewanella schlegeliana]
MKYSLKQITVFDAVASLESVSAAARKLSMTQSAVSMSLAQLENLLGRPLFIRQGNRLTLSHWGNWLRPKARRLLQEAQHIEFGLHEQHLISGQFRLCSSQTAAEHLIPELISKIDTDFPELRIDLSVENTENVIEGLLNYEFDLGIIEGRNDDSRLHKERWIDDHLVIISSPNHPYAKYESASLSQLEQAKWVLREQGAGTRRIFEGAIHGIIEKLNVWKEYEQVPVLKALVKNGQYISSLPYLDVEKDVANGELVILATPQINMQRHLSFIWRADSGDNPLRDCIITEAKRLSRMRQVKS